MAWKIFKSNSNAMDCETDTSKCTKVSQQEMYLTLTVKNLCNKLGDEKELVMDPAFSFVIQACFPQRV